MRGILLSIFTSEILKHGKTKIVLFFETFQTQIDVLIADLKSTITCGINNWFQTLAWCIWVRVICELHVAILILNDLKSIWLRQDIVNVLG